MNSHSSYKIRIAGENNSFCADGFSQYNARLSLAFDNKLPHREVYGLEQARQHIAELRKHIWNGKKIHAEATFEIVHCVATETVVDILDPKDYSEKSELAKARAERDAALQLVREFRGNVDVSRINNSKKSTARWTELVLKAEALLSS